MKFLADMGISPKTVAFLREQGYEAVHLHEEGLDRLEDPAILAKAREEGFILLKDGSGFALFPCGRRSNYHQAKA